MEEFFLNASAYASASGSGLLDFALTPLYSDLPSARARYAELAISLSRVPEAAEGDAFFFSVPGRIELCGNHLDHQRGHVIAAAVDRDVAACATKGSCDMVSVLSAGYPAERLSLASLSPVEKERGKASALIRGVLAFLKREGYRIGPFTACTHSQIPGGAGLSSSAAFT